MTRWQKNLEKSGWNALFIENHDKPRIVSTWGNDNAYWRDSATAFATVYMLMMGTPFVYQGKVHWMHVDCRLGTYSFVSGQEIGMTNVRYPSINDYCDVATKNLYQAELAKGTEHDTLMQMIYATSRDNARTPMQWNESKHAGFSQADRTWIDVNPNYIRINVAQQENDEHSILNFYKRLIHVRKVNDIFVDGIYDLILSEHTQIYAYTRTSNTERIYVLTNLSHCLASFTLEQNLSLSQLILSNRIESVPEHEVI
jgi:alpha-glucosidase